MAFKVQEARQDFVAGTALVSLMDNSTTPPQMILITWVPTAVDTVSRDTLVAAAKAHLQAAHDQV